LCICSFFVDLFPKSMFPVELIHVVYGTGSNICGVYLILNC
jgi:hypothetical protein